MSTGAVALLYVTEVCADVASGLVSGCMFLNLTILTLTFEMKLESALDVHGTIWYYAVMNFAGFLFCLLFVRETCGLTDLQKKSLYAPKSVHPFTDTIDDCEVQKDLASSPKPEE
jgi:hypothetical protein|uniref:Uncharacterized protein n=1 Tax=Favella ehrenbergii TaxID=182087 RepID=A0A7S3MKI0_9SPIT|mmetsp:Transcript_25447/g.29880  ORF Transcript_25447/g.29880 Transcript_25447/m.29880 type:complete len:115 (+) Transcript_25447:1354-1698(+)